MAAADLTVAVLGPGVTGVVLVLELDSVRQPRILSRGSDWASGRLAARRRGPGPGPVAGGGPAWGSSHVTSSGEMSQPPSHHLGENHSRHYVTRTELLSEPGTVAAAPPRRRPQPERRPRVSAGGHWSQWARGGLGLSPSFRLHRVTSHDRQSGLLGLRVLLAEAAAAGDCDAGPADANGRDVGGLAISAVSKCLEFLLIIRIFCAQDSSKRQELKLGTEGKQSLALLVLSTKSSCHFRFT